MYTQSNFKGNPTYANATAPYYPIKLRKKLDADEVEPLEQFTTKDNHDTHTEFISKELVSSRRLPSAKDATYLGF